jgi:hypothetical protein
MMGIAFAFALGAKADVVAPPICALEKEAS